VLRNGLLDEREEEVSGGGAAVDDKQQQPNGCSDDDEELSESQSPSEEEEGSGANHQAFGGATEGAAATGSGSDDGNGNGREGSGRPLGGLASVLAPPQHRHTVPGAAEDRDDAQSEGSEGLEEEVEEPPPGLAPKERKKWLKRRERLRKKSVREQQRLEEPESEKEAGAGIAEPVAEEVEPEPEPQPSKQQQQQQQCWDCSGEGVVGRGKRRKKCPACDGTGVCRAVPAPETAPPSPPLKLTAKQQKALRKMKAAARASGDAQLAAAVGMAGGIAIGMAAGLATAMQVRSAVLCASPQLRWPGISSAVCGSDTRHVLLSPPPPRCCDHCDHCVAQSERLERLDGAGALDEDRCLAGEDDDVSDATGGGGRDPATAEQQQQQEEEQEEGEGVAPDAAGTEPRAMSKRVRTLAAHCCPCCRAWVPTRYLGADACIHACTHVCVMSVCGRVQDKRRAKKADREQTASSAEGLHICQVCQAAFPSRSKLFKHIELTGHAILVDGGGGGGGSKKKKKKKK
jgi:hypothetical protein